MAMVNASNAMLKVLEDWGVRNIYGLPGGSFDSTMNAIHDFKDRINYVGVRHEEAGAIAATAEAKLTGKIGVTFGSAGPGAVHLLNGLYDARADHAPVLALVGQVPSGLMNMDFFQEQPENPIFEDVAVYNRTVMTAEQLPAVVDAAIRHALAAKGVAVVVIPKDLGWKQIEDNYVSSASAWHEPEWKLPPSAEDVEKTLDMILAAERPVIYFGQGTRGHGAQLTELSELLGTPLVSTYLGRGVINDDFPAYMQSVGRVATKPAEDVARTMDMMVFLGTNYEFGARHFNPAAKFVDVNIDPTVIGARHAAEIGIRADAGEFLDALLAAAKARNLEAGTLHTAWYQAAKDVRANWREWIESRFDDDRSPVRLEALFHQINRHSAEDAVYGIDVGNVNIATARFLEMNPDRRFTTSALYATMGYGVPAGIAAALTWPGRQVWTISGDGAFAMNAQDLVTQRNQHLPVINIVLSNGSLGYIEAEQDDTKQPHSGVDLDDVDFAKVAEGYGVKGYTARTLPELTQILDHVAGTAEPVVVDVKVTDDRLIPTEQFPLARDGRPDFDDYLAKYEAQALRPFAEILADNGLSI